MTRTVTISASILVTMAVDVEDCDDGARVVGIRNVIPPSPREVMEALEADDACYQIDPPKETR